MNSLHRRKQKTETSFTLHELLRDLTSHLAGGHCKQINTMYNNRAENLNINKQINLIEMEIAFIYHMYITAQ